MLFLLRRCRPAVPDAEMNAPPALWVSTKYSASSSRGLPTIAALMGAEPLQ